MVGLLLLAGPSHAEHNGTPPQCGPRDQFLEVIRKRYREDVIHQGVRGTGEIFTITVSAKRTWTLLFSDAKNTCAIAVGTDWGKSVKKDGGYTVYHGIVTSTGSPVPLLLHVNDEGLWFVRFPGSDALTPEQSGGDGMQTFWGRLGVPS